MHPAASQRSLLAAPGLRILLAAIFLSRSAARLLMLTIVLSALGRFGSPAIVGALLDRMGPARGVALNMAASAVPVLATVLLDAMGLASEPVVMALVALDALTSPLGMAGVRVRMPRIVPAEGLERANALDTATHALVNVTGTAARVGALLLIPARDERAAGMSPRGP